MTKDKGYSEMSSAQVKGYTFLTTIYIIFIAVLMIKLSGWWFLALFLWNWKWNKDRE